jgi:hypothetical protein
MKIFNGAKRSTKVPSAVWNLKKCLFFLGIVLFLVAKIDK